MSQATQYQTQTQSYSDDDLEPHHENEVDQSFQIQELAAAYIERRYSSTPEAARLFVHQYAFDSLTYEDVKSIFVLLCDSYDSDLETLLSALRDHLQPDRDGDDLGERVNLVHDTVDDKWYQLGFHLPVYRIRNAAGVADSVSLVFNTYAKIAQRLFSFSSLQLEEEKDVALKNMKKRIDNAQRYVKLLGDRGLLDSEEFAFECDTAPYAMMFKNGEMEVTDQGVVVCRLFPECMPTYRWTKHNGINLDSDLVSDDDILSSPHYVRFNKYFSDTFPTEDESNAAKFIMGHAAAGIVPGMNHFAFMLMSGVSNTGKSTYMVFLRNFLGDHISILSQANPILHVKTMDRSVLQSLANKRLVEFVEVSSEEKAYGNNIKQIGDDKVTGIKTFKRRFPMIMAHYNGTLRIADGHGHGQAMQNRLEMMLFRREVTTRSELKSDMEVEEYVKQLSAHYVIGTMVYHMRRCEKLMRDLTGTADEKAKDALRSIMPPEWRRQAENTSGLYNHVLDAVTQAGYTYSQYEKDRVKAAEIRGIVMKYCAEKGVNIGSGSSEVGRNVLYELNRAGWVGCESRNMYYTNIQKPQQKKLIFTYKGKPVLSQFRPKTAASGSESPQVTARSAPVSPVSKRTPVVGASSSSTQEDNFWKKKCEELEKNLGLLVEKEVEKRLNDYIAQKGLDRSGESQAVDLLSQKNTPVKEKEAVHDEVVTDHEVIANMDKLLHEVQAEPSTGTKRKLDGDGDDASLAPKKKLFENRAPEDEIDKGIDF